MTERRKETDLERFSRRMRELGDRGLHRSAWLSREAKKQPKPLLAVIVVAVLVLGAVAWLAVQSGKNRSEYTKHNPISINGNGGFTLANGVVRGIGTASDPYIISNWDINAAHSSGISIHGTDAHFVVMNCYVHGGMYDHNGIDLLNCVNGTLENDTCSNDNAGIFLDSSSYNTLINNNCSSNNGIVINLVSSSNNTLINNTCDSSNGIGINLMSSNDNALSNNSCSNDPSGICLVSSSDNTLSDNNCNSNDAFGILITSGDNILVDNSCSWDHDGIYLWSSSDNTLRNNNCSSNNRWGMYLSSSSDNILSNNTCSSNAQQGMYLDWSSNNNILINNNCSSNGKHGIWLDNSSNNNELSNNLVYTNEGYCVRILSSSDNLIWNNTFIGNDGANDTYNAPHAQACDAGTHNLWNSTGGYGNYWSDWTTPDVVPPWAIVDRPYVILGSAGARDYHPLTTPPIR